MTYWRTILQTRESVQNSHTMISKQMSAPVESKTIWGCTQGAKHKFTPPLYQSHRELIKMPSQVKKSTDVTLSLVRWRRARQVATLLMTYTSFHSPSVTRENSSSTKAQTCWKAIGLTVMQRVFSQWSKDSRPNWRPHMILNQTIL